MSEFVAQEYTFLLLLGLFNFDDWNKDVFSTTSFPLSRLVPRICEG
jgi:hypothetical protein